MKQIIKYLIPGAIALALAAGIHAQDGGGRRGPKGGGPGGQGGQGGPGAERGPGGHRPPPPPVMTALDTDGNGELSADEIAKAADSLKKLDKNGDGKLTHDELRPAPPEGGGPGPGQGGPGGPGGGGGRQCGDDDAPPR